MDHKKKFQRSFQTMQLLPKCRCKCTFEAYIESRVLYNFCETLLVFENSETKDRMRNKREMVILTHACFSALNPEKRLMSVKQSIKSYTSQVISPKNKVVVLETEPMHLTCK